MNPKLKKLIDDTPIYDPPIEDKEPGIVILKSEDVDEIAQAYEDDCPVKHKYNSFDGWSIFSKGKYQRVEDPKEIRLWIRTFLAKCKLKKKKMLVPIKRKTNGFISDVLEAVASLPEVHLIPSQKAPCDLDNKLDPTTTIAAGNCLVNVQKYPYTIHNITNRYYTVNYLNYNYDSEAYSELWTKFLIDITLGDLDLLMLLQQWCGYLLLPTLKYQKFLLCVGDGANGKGVFFDTITSALGKQNVSNVPLARFADKHTLYGTYAKLVNMSNENTKDIESNTESIIKEYVAGDKILWEQKYKNPFFAYPTAKLMFATNELPRIRDHTDGIWRRMILVPFKAKFSEDIQDRDLTKKLQQTTELSGILNWMLEGARMLEDKGRFVEPKIVKDALNEYRDQSDSARLFLLENIEVDTQNECKIPVTMLHKWYQEWCKNNGFQPKNNVHFGHSVNQLHRVQKARIWINEKKINIYLGCRPQEGSDVEEKMSNWMSNWAN